MSQTSKQRKAIDAHNTRRRARSGNAAPLRETRGNVIQWRVQRESNRAKHQPPLPSTPANKYTEPTLLTMVIATPFALALWALFGWVGASLIDVVRGML